MSGEASGKLDYENIVMNLINCVLEELELLKDFKCSKRKNKGKSAIDKPVDLHIHKDKDKGVICIEVSNVNSTQLVGEIYRLYADSLWRKLLVVVCKNNDSNGNIRCKEAEKICKDMIPRLYSQDEIKSTPMRVLYIERSKLGKLKKQENQGKYCKTLKEELNKEFEKLKSILEEFFLIKRTS